jgi:hypothetical protein
MHLHRIVSIDVNASATMFATFSGLVCICHALAWSALFQLQLSVSHYTKRLLTMIVAVLIRSQHASGFVKHSAQSSMVAHLSHRLVYAYGSSWDSCSPILCAFT